MVVGQTAPVCTTVSGASTAPSILVLQGGYKGSTSRPPEPFGASGAPRCAAVRRAAPGCITAAQCLWQAPGRHAAGKSCLVPLRRPFEKQVDAVYRQELSMAVSRQFVRPAFTRDTRVRLPCFLPQRSAVRGAQEGSLHGPAAVRQAAPGCTTASGASTAPSVLVHQGGPGACALASRQAVQLRCR